MNKTKSSHILDVYLEDRLIGELTELPTGAIEFKYSQKWLNDAHRFPVSYSLPLTEKLYAGAEVRNFFNNLLPDNEKVKERLAVRVHANSSHDFDLLGAVGKDCVGAFLFLPHGSPAPKLKSASGTPLTPKKISQILEALPIAPLGNDFENDFRISIAGAQDKCGFLFLNDQWNTPIGTTPTSHIFKTTMGMLPNGIDLSTSIENEWLCLRLTRALGLDTADAKIGVFENQKCLIVTRFDRKWTKEKKTLHRLPQEDLCQALGFSSSKKYESDGGPGIQAIMNLLMTSDYPQRDRSQFMRALLVFFLLGATDGHAKNFSIFNTQTGFFLTPIYDVISAYPALHKKQIRQNQVRLSMAVGNSRKYKWHEIHRRYWYETAKLCDFPASELDRLIEDLTQKMENLLDTGIQLPPGFPKWVYTSILDGMSTALRRLH